MIKIVKQSLLCILCIAVLFGFAPMMPGASDVAMGAAKYKKVKNVSKFKYKKYVQGNLSKKQLELVFGSLSNYAYKGISKKKAITSKDLNGRVTDKYYKKPSVPLAVGLAGMKNYRDDYSDYYYVYKISDINRILSFFTSYRYEKNTDYTSNADFFNDEEDLYGAYTDDNYLYFSRVFDWFEECVIKTVKYNKKYMIIGYDRIEGGDAVNGAVLGRYTATLKKQNNKKYKLVKIKVRKATTKEKALEAYKKKIIWFQVNKSEGAYKISDYDGDGSKELLVKYRAGSGSGRPVAIYKYMKGKLKKLIDAGAYTEKIIVRRKGKYVIYYTCSHANEMYEYYARNNKTKKYKMVASKTRYAKAAGAMENSAWDYYVKNKIVKKKVFQKKVKKMTTGKRKIYNISKWKIWDNNDYML